MKFISLLVFSAALWASWHISHQSLPVAESVHMGIQEDLKSIISDYIQKQVPEATDIRFERMWTETVSDTRVKAQFIYSFVAPTKEDGTTRTEIDGYALLSKLKESPEQVQYSFDELHIENSSITFDEPMKITAGSEE